MDMAVQVLGVMGMVMPRAVTVVMVVTAMIVMVIMVMTVSMTVSMAVVVIVPPMHCWSPIPVRRHRALPECSPVCR